MKVDCSEGCPVRATFFCSRCKKPFCDQCSGLKEKGKRYCLNCAAVLHTEKPKKNIELGIDKGLSKPLKVTLLLTTAVAALYLFIAGNGQPSSDRATLPPLTQTQVRDLQQCKEQLQGLSMLVANYQRSHGFDPEVIEDVIESNEDARLLLEPVDEYEYGLERLPDAGLVISCPNPDEHHLDALYIIPGSTSVIMQSGD